MINPIKHFITRDKYSKPNVNTLTITKIPGTKLYRATRILKHGNMSKKSSNATGTIEEWQDTANETGDILDVR